MNDQNVILQQHVLRHLRQNALDKQTLQQNEYWNDNNTSSPPKVSSPTSKVTDVSRKFLGDLITKNLQNDNAQKPGQQAARNNLVNNGVTNSASANGIDFVFIYIRLFG